MRAIPEYEGSFTRQDFEKQLREAGTPLYASFSRAQLAGCVYVAHLATVQAVNREIREAILADRKATFEALRHHPGCLIPSDQLRELTGIPA